MLPKIDHLNSLTSNTPITGSSNLELFLSQTTKKPKHQLLVSINSPSKNETMPLSYLKDLNQASKAPIISNSRYVKTKESTDKI